jgi:hypothetical protein
LIRPEDVVFETHEDGDLKATFHRLGLDCLQREFASQRNASVPSVHKGSANSAVGLFQGIDLLKGQGGVGSGGGGGGGSGGGGLLSSAVTLDQRTTPILRKASEPR